MWYGILSSTSGGGGKRGGMGVPGGRGASCVRNYNKGSQRKSDMVWQLVIYKGAGGRREKEEAWWCQEVEGELCKELQ